MCRRSNVFAGLTLLTLLPAPSGAAEPELPARDIYKKTLSGTAWVAIPTGETTFDIGTAWIADRSRKLLVTSYHVVGTRDKVRLLFPSYDGKRLVAERDHYMQRVSDGKYVAGTLLDVDLKRDLALIEADSLPDGATELKLADESPEPGDRLHAIGNPKESQGHWLYITGTVRQVYRKQEHLLGSGPSVDLDARVVETQLAINPGDSGGPVVDDRGRLVGLTTSFRPLAPSLASCVAVEEIRAFLKEHEEARGAKTADELNARGVRYFDKAMWERAASDFTAAIKLDAKKSLYHRNRAWVRLRQKDYAKAVEDFTAAIQLDPKNVVTLNDRGFAYLSSDKLAEAVADFTAAIELDPKYATARNNRGFTRAKKGDLAAALADYDVAIELNPKNETAFHNRGLVHIQRGDFAKAVADFTEAIRLQPRFAVAYADRARAHDGNNEAEKAKADRAKAAELDPSLGKK